MAKIIYLKGQHHILESSFATTGVIAKRSQDDSIYFNADIIYDLTSVKSSSSSKIAKLDERTIIRTKPHKASTGLISWHAISTELSIDEVIKLINE
jgi:hypothetical protein